MDAYWWLPIVLAFVVIFLIGGMTLWREWQKQRKGKE